MALAWLRACKRRLLNRLSNILNLRHVVSWADAIRLTGKTTGGNDEGEVFLRMLDRRVIIRQGTSDTYCLYKVFMNLEYQLPFDTANPRLIVDAGANIGLATLYFANLFPNAKIISIEPELSNYELLVRNCSGIANVSPRHAALWSTETSLQIANPEAEKWCFKVSPGKDTGPAIKALTIPQILAESDDHTIDILKLDIEGAERELFSDGCEAWLPHVAVIVIELHDRYVPGCSRALYSKLCQMAFSQETRGENVFIRLGSDK
jgi:FkbM family methyltransferase